jgi:class 3 adenylate cyclase
MSRPPRLPTWIREEWAEIINGAFEHMIQPIYQYEGTVARLQGDGILAFFGAPVAHEDDPERAVLAGLEIIRKIQPYSEQVKRQWDINLTVRVGINTGLVVVGEVGSDLRVEYTALGDAINLAARMEQNAEPGTVLVAESTYRLVAPLFDIEVIEGLAVKGYSKPLTAYRPIRRKEQPGSLRGLLGLSSP